VRGTSVTCEARGVIGARLGASSTTSPSRECASRENFRRASVDGKTYRTIARAPADPGFPEIGDAVTVYYDPNDPKSSELRSEREDRASAASPFVWLAFALIALLVWVVRSRRRER
jgi:hypothetical protein